MAKGDITAHAAPKLQKVAEEMAFELVDVCLDKEPQGKYLRVYLDKPEGISLDDCEAFHRAIIPLVEAYDYDFLEVSSPGVDRPLKTARDYERHMGDEVEVKFYKPIDGQKRVEGILADFDDVSVTLEVSGVQKAYDKRFIAIVKPIVDMDGVETVDLSDE